ncbi:MAG: glutathione peroxidase [Planctomycetes bacterium]|nr:glutathione peroxidase [Planctomycetota bacterium]
MSTFNLLVPLSLCLASLSCAVSSGDKTPAKEGAKEEARASGFYALGAADLEGKDQALSRYAGKVALVVNTASECGFTPQYEGLQKLYAELAPRGFVVLGWPSNDFGGQEPGTAAEIKTFCTDNYHVTFPMFAKVVTKAGPEQSPIYDALGKATGKLPNWNFCKYLIGKDGKIQGFYPSKVAPDDAELRKAIEAALAAH